MMQYLLCLESLSARDRRGGGADEETVMLVNSAFMMKPISNVSDFPFWSSERIYLWALISQRSSLLFLM